MSPGTGSVADDPHAAHRSTASHESHHSQAGGPAQGDHEESESPADGPLTCVVHSACGNSVASISQVLDDVPCIGIPTSARLSERVPSPDLSQDPPPPRPLR
jgi:hypothetical protein